jgi:hypothetical protein
MPFQKGNKLAAGGRKDKPWTDALRVAMYRDDRKALTDIAEVVKGLALAGDMQAIKEIGDRLDGKPAQESTVTIDDKRDATDWTRDELVAFLNEQAAGGDGAAKTNGSGRKSDRVH